MSTSSQTTVLVVDDSPFARQATMVCLRAALTQEVRFVEAGDGEQALAAMSEAAPRLVVTDLNMPKMDGGKLLARIKANPKFHRTPVIVVSSVVGTSVAEELRQRGACAVLTKPLTGPKAAEVIEGLFPEEDEP